MKVIGTGAPRMLTIRFEPCELEVLRDELEELRSVIVEAIAHAQQPSKRAQPTLPGAERPEQELERRHDELLLIAGCSTTCVGRRRAMSRASSSGRRGCWAR